MDNIGLRYLPAGSRPAKAQLWRPGWNGLCKYFLIALLLILQQHAHAQKSNCNYNFSDIVKHEVSEFISKSDKKFKSTPWKLYAIRFYHLRKDMQDISFTISYIRNESEFDEINASYVFIVGDKYVIARLSDTSYLSTLNGLGFKKIGEQEGEISCLTLTKKLYLLGSISYSADGFVYSLSNGSVYKKYYPYAVEIPDEINVLPPLYFNIIIDSIKPGSFRK